jgi:hypothetical protein
VGTSVVAPTSRAGLDGTPVTGSPKDLILVGTVDSNRMIGLSGADLRAGRKPAVRWASSVFGAVIEAVTDGMHVWALSTNTPDLVRMSLQSNTLASRSVTSEVGVVARPNFGSLLFNGGLLYVSFDAGSQVTVAAIDPSTLRVVRHRTFTDRYAAYPHMCQVDQGHLAVQWSWGVDILDARTLARTASSALATPNGLACGDGKVYAANYETPDGAILDPSARKIGSFSWKGHGSDKLIFDRIHHRVYGTDDRGSAVFECQAPGGTCASATLPDKPTSMVITGDRLLVTVEGAMAVAVLEAPSLRLLNSWDVGGITRTLVAT